MYTRWTQHLTTEEDKQKFRNSVLSARVVLERLRDIVNEDEDSLSHSELGQKQYDISNWSELQAHKNGNRQYMHEMRLLIDLDQQKGQNELTRSN